MKKKQKVKPADWKVLTVLVALTLVFGGGIVYISLPRSGTRATAWQAPPPYFTSAEAAKPFPQTLDPGKFADKDIAAAYLVAKKAPGVLAQQPCFCHCHRSGHRSLLDCFATKHGAECSICVKEAIFADRENQNGKNAEQIRWEILHGTWKTVRLVNSITSIINQGEI